MIPTTPHSGVSLEDCPEQWINELSKYFLRPILARPYAGGTRLCFLHPPKSPHCLLIFYTASSGSPPKYLLSRYDIFRMILLGGGANAPGVWLLADDKRGYRSVLRAGSWRRAWLWRRMKNCHWEEDRQWSESGGRARRQVLPSSSVSLGPAILTRVHCSTHTIKC